MNLEGILIGAGTFIIIGILHPVVIKTEYYIGKKAWPAFGVLGLGCVIGSVFIASLVVSALCAVLGFSLLWGIRELFEQEERVKKGWHPSNPNKKSLPD
ncbi:MAG: DUF4491 family protein [Christensenellales bacterium]